MAIIYGQIESLTRLKENLHINGIDDFSSVKQIEVFQKNYHENVINIECEEVKSYKLEFEELRDKIGALEESLEKQNSDAKPRLDSILKPRREKVKTRKAKYIKNDFLDFFYWAYTLLLKLQIFFVEKSFLISHSEKQRLLKRQIFKVKRTYSHFEKNRESIIQTRLKPKLKRINLIKNVLDALNPLIAGAKGENLVQKEIKKLSDEYILFNDFSMEFNPPIYNRNEDDRIFSIQIDHVLVCKAGVIAIETKNWSNSTINNNYLKSPVKQIQRTGYALFTLLNSKRNPILKLIHQWGKRTIPVKNLVVMINNKPHSNFDYVTVKNLGELNSYLKILKPIFDASELDGIAKRIKKLGNYN